METIKTYKGFNKDMKCRDFQYEEGEEYETREAEVCSCGFHACEHPLDCFNYYRPSKSIYHEVEQSGKISKESNDSKIASTKIKIGARLSISGLVEAAIEYTKERTKPESDSSSDCGASSATGYKGASSAENPNTVAVAWGYKGKAKGVKGSFLVLADWKCKGEESNNYWKEDMWELKNAVRVRVDGETIKEDTWYTMVDGKVVEVDV